MIVLHHHSLRRSLYVEPRLRYVWLIRPHLAQEDDCRLLCVAAASRHARRADARPWSSDAGSTHPTAGMQCAPALNAALAAWDKLTGPGHPGGVYTPETPPPRLQRTARSPGPPGGGALWHLYHATPGAAARR